MTRLLIGVGTEVLFIIQMTSTLCECECFIIRTKKKLLFFVTVKPWNRGIFNCDFWHRFLGQIQFKICPYAFLNYFAVCWM